MSDLSSFAFVITLMSTLFFYEKRLKTYLHLFQQDEYDGRRFFLWMLRTFTIDKRLSLSLLTLILLGSRIEPKPDYALAFGTGLLIFLFAMVEKNPIRRAKKKLVMTLRARRIFWLSYGFLAMPTVIFSLWLDWKPWPYLVLILFIQLVPLSLILSNALLRPLEMKIQQQFWQEAKDKLTACNPLIIGITGSFGKTSVKHILGHILSLHAPSLMTPGSVNTPMGIARIVREQLTPDHRYFIAEMGAYGKGSIDRLCQLAPPDFGLITAIGHAHYERFKSLDQVASAKFELGERVADKAGKLFFPRELLAFQAVQDFVAAHPQATVTLGLTPPETKETGERSDLRLDSVEQTSEGLKLVIKEREEAHKLVCPLYGRHQAGNILLAFALARELGMRAEQIAVALKSVPQVAHRLEVKPQNGWILIDDAYNANPQGMIEGMKLLDLFVKEGGRRILITPGLVELGTQHDLEHERLGRLAVDHVDRLCVVNPARVKSLTDGFRTELKRAGTKRAKDKKIEEFQSFSQANAWLLTQLRAGDAVLLANDLPDIYESRPRI